MPTLPVFAARGRVRWLVLPLLLTLAVLGQAPATAVTALDAPLDIAPSSTTVTGIPTLTWSRVTGAKTYSVEVSASPTFATTLWKVTTVNATAVPTVQVPSGTLYWRVRATAGTVLSNWSTATFTRAAVAGPTNPLPASGTVFAQPTQPPVISWDPLTGVSSYTVQVSADSTFPDSSVTHSYTTKGNSLVVASLLPSTTYYWRVKGALTTTSFTDWSATRSFSMGKLAKPTLVSPATGLGTQVDDVILDWAPVNGAAAYDLQISNDPTFVSVPAADVKNIPGTRYSPPNGLVNGAWYWRVRPIDSQGNKLDWSLVDVWSFTRSWTLQPTLEAPANGATVGDPLFYQWTPVRLATRYTLQLSTSSDFSAAHIVDECTTAQTTYTPVSISDCYPDADGLFYWRVYATDDPTSSGSLVNTTSKGSAQVFSFTYKNTVPTLVSPAAAASVSVPTLKWNAVNGAARYKVTIQPVNVGDLGGDVAYTTGTSWTPRTPLQAGSSYRWQVQTVSVTGREGSATATGSQRTFTYVAPAAPTAATPEPTGTAQTTSRFPTLTWTPVVGANNYSLQVRLNGTSTWFTLDPSFVFPAGEDDTVDWLSPGVYQWRVQAFTGNTLISTSSTTSTFTITGLSAVSGQRVAMTGNATAASTSWCALASPTSCTNLRQTPVFGWNSDVDAAYYKLYLAKDSALTQEISGFPKVVESTRFAPILALPDSGAGVYFWGVQACKANGICNTLNTATNQFTKTSKPVQLLTPAVDAVVANEITFTWRDYLATNQDLTAFPVADSGNVQTVAPRIEAKQYRVQISAESDFSTTLENVVVDQQTFTSYVNTYPEGTLYWRVAAIDSASNALPFSAGQRFTKTSPKVVPVAPRNQVTVPGAATFTWNPLAYAASYDIEVYKNADTSASATNRIVLGHSKFPAYSRSTPLPVADTAYLWRVRAVDFKGRPSPWTSLVGTGAQFFVTGAAPTLASPSGGSLVPTNGAVFAWNAVAGASNYRIERRRDGSLSAAGTVTAATSWAPTSAIATGKYEWRVSALDTAGRVLGSSAWRVFKVDASAPKVSSYGPKAAVPKGTNFTAVFNEEVTNVTDTTFTITPASGSNALPATVTLSGDGQTATLNPDSPLVAGKKYVVKLGSGITDLQGNHMNNLTWTVTAK